MKKQWRIIKGLITVSRAVLIVPLLVAFLALTFPAEVKNSNASYEGTKLSYFAADKWVSEEAQKDFEDVIYFFEDVNWSEYTGQILRICFNPGEAAKVFEEELRVDPAELFTGMNSAGN